MYAEPPPLSSAFRGLFMLHHHAPITPSLTLASPPPCVRLPRPPLNQLLTNAPAHPLHRRAHPLLAVISDGQVTALKVTGGLSAPLNLRMVSAIRIPQGCQGGAYQSKRQLQPALSFSGKPSHSLLEWIPPYRSPQPLEGAPYCWVQAGDEC